MSLLMDALKKAEQEKKEAAKRLKQTGPNPIVDTGEHKIQAPDSLENTGPQEMTVSQEMDLSLEPIDASQIVSPPHDYTDEYPVGENTAEIEIRTEDAKAESEVDASAELPIQENTQEMSTELPVIMDRSGDFSYDNTQEEVIDEDEYPSPFIDNDYGFDETLDSVTASQLMADIGGGLDQPTPVAANTVFEASRTSQWALGSRWALLGICAMIILVAGGVIIHYQTTPIARDIPKPVALPDEILAQQAALAALPKPSLPPEPVFPVPATGSISAEEASLSTDEAATADMAVEVADAELPPVSEPAGSEGEMPATSVMEPEMTPIAEEPVTTEPVIAMQVFDRAPVKNLGALQSPARRASPILSF